MRTAVLTLALVFSIGLTGCVRTQWQPVEHYVSPHAQVQGEEQKINLEEVQNAFWETKAKDFNSWMAAFEKRVNEIYEGKEVVSIDATRKDGKLTVTGYFENKKENKKEQGYQPDEEKLFQIEQTGEVADNELPYRMTGSGGTTYYEGHHSILGNPIVQMMVLSHLMGGWGGRYYTPYERVVVIRDHRDTFRTTPTYTTQKSANQGFFSRFKEKSGGGFASKTKFGGSSFSEGASTTKRTWGGFSSGSTSTSTSKSPFGGGWGGRRSSGFSRGWGGRRR